MALDLAQLDAFSRNVGPCIIGVSGGRDSIALLHMLHERKCAGLVVAHLDHQLRRESADDANFVARVALEHGLACVTGTADTHAPTRETKGSIETVAREARYRFFTQVARDRGLARVVLAHHADDQVETVLFNFLRGSGLTGLSGMAPATVRAMDGFQLTILRPLLDIWRVEIDAYVAEHRLEYRDDRTNEDPRHTRNRVRQKLIPLLEEIFGRDVRPTILRMAKMLRAENEFLERNVPDTRVEELPVALVKSLPDALQRRLIHRWLKSHDARDVGFEVVERVRALCHDATAKTNLAGDRHVRRRGMKLFFEE
jgi:tRNA(Ile)-lysidine synthase